MEVTINGKVMRLNVIPLHEIKPYENNVKQHPVRQLEGLTQSINRFGFKQPIVIDKNNVIVAGHARYEAAAAIGYEELLCVLADDLSEEEINAYRILDNEIAANGSTDFDALQIELAKLPDFDFTPFNVEFPSIEEVKEGLTDEDETPELKIEATTKLGDVWILGNHRLMCGDSTMIDSVEKLMNGEKADMVFTDPPYNTGMTSESQKGSGGLWKGNGSTWLSHMFNDSYAPDEWQAFMSSFMSSYWMLMKEDSTLYICLDWRRNHELIPHIENNGFKRSNLIVWDKMVHGLGSDYKYTHEFINVCKKGKPLLDTHQGDDREYSDVWHIQRKMGKDEDHATKKPIELVERSIRHASKKNNLVVDLFGGSGSTLIACEKTNRKCFMMELSPNYCDVIIKRWQDFTGKKAIHAETNKIFDELIPLV
jgi:DNA modification methylase